MLTYKEEFDSFMASYSAGAVSAEVIGREICQMAQYFCTANMNKAAAEKCYNRIIAQLSSSIDNGKPISSAKATTLSEATPEYEKMLDAKTELENIDQIINALKSLQKGVLQEFAHVSV
jgi:hypothetical protein